MEEAAIIEQLILFGLSRQEAAIYLCLLQNEELTGYEVAKLTGISRSNVYNGLASLVEHGAAYVIEGTSSKYLAVALSEFCDNRIRYLRKAKERLVADGPRKNLPREGYITIEGYDHICDKIRHMLLGAEKRIYFSATGEFLEQWSEEIRGAGPGTEKSGADFRRQQRTFSGRCGIKGRDHRIPGAGAFQRA